MGSSIFVAHALPRALVQAGNDITETRSCMPTLIPNLCDRVSSKRWFLSFRPHRKP